MRNPKYIGDSWQGLQRDSNKDGYHIINTGNYFLFMIFDGVSSSENARLGVDTLIKFCEKSHDIYYQNDNFMLSHMIEDMNICLLHSKTKDVQTTCSIAYIPCNEELPLKITHLGDSRIYGITPVLELYTEDHNDPLKPNLLTKCLGLDRLVEEDFYEKSIMKLPGRLLLCTDGFYNTLDHSPVFFKDLMNLPDLQAAKAEIAENIKFHNYDDATYLLVEI